MWAGTMFKMMGTAASAQYQIKAIKTKWKTEQALYLYNQAQFIKSGRLEETAAGIERVGMSENAKREIETRRAASGASGVLLKGSPELGILRFIEDAATVRGLRSYNRSLKAAKLLDKADIAGFLARQARRAGKLAETAVHIGAAAQNLSSSFSFGGGGGQQPAGSVNTAGGGGQYLGGGFGEGQYGY